MTENKVQISFRAEESLKRRFYSKLELNGVDVAEFFRDAMDGYLSRRDGNAPHVPVVAPKAAHARCYALLEAILLYAPEPISSHTKSFLEIHGAHLLKKEKKGA